MEDERLQSSGPISRRQFLRGALALAALAVISPAALLDSCKTPEQPGGTTPALPVGEDTEKAVLAAAPQIRPADAPPSSTGTYSASDNYSLSVDGLVNTPLSLNYDSILQFPAVTKTVTLTCPGVFEETSDWTGVPLVTLLNAAGLKPEATQVQVRGSSGYAAPFSVQEQAVVAGDILLAFEYNGQGLPADRGYPLRLVVPGADGVAWVKGVTGIRILP